MPNKNGFFTFLPQVEQKLKFPFIDHMKKTTVPYMDWNTCMKSYQDWPLCKNLTICPVVTDICSGGNDTSKEDCASDTGGPVIDINKKVYIIIRVEVETNFFQNEIYFFNKLMFSNI